MLYIFNRKKLTYRKIDIVILVSVFFAILIVGFIFAYILSKKDRIVYVKEIIYKTNDDVQRTIILRGLKDFFQ